MLPGCSEMAIAALRASRLQSPSMYRSNVYDGLSWLSILAGFNPGIKKGLAKGGWAEGEGAG